MEYKVKALCACCMETHEISIVTLSQSDEYKGKLVRYDASYTYCENADEYFETEAQLAQNDTAFKNAYRRLAGLLTGDEIKAIREKYGISQTDLAIMLGWGAKTITRYEGHQIQDAAHDTLMRKLDTDPEWFLSLLDGNKAALPEESYRRYRESAVTLYAQYTDSYLRKSILARYAKFNGDVQRCGNQSLNLDKVVEVIGYFASSKQVNQLYTVKLMKLMWYMDALSFKLRGRSVTGMAYSALPMGAVPLAYESIISLMGVYKQEVDFFGETGVKFVAPPDFMPHALTPEDIVIIDKVISVCGKDTTHGIVNRMHGEQAYKLTARNEIIRYEHANQLSLD